MCKHEQLAAFASTITAHRVAASGEVAVTTGAPYSWENGAEIAPCHLCSHARLPSCNSPIAWGTPACRIQAPHAWQLPPHSDKTAALPPVLTCDRAPVCNPGARGKRFAEAVPWRGTHPQRRHRFVGARPPQVRARQQALLPAVLPVPQGRGPQLAGPQRLPPAQAPPARRALDA